VADPDRTAAGDLTDKVAELIGRTYCPRKGCDGCTDWGRPTALAVLDLLASLAGTDRDGLAALLSTVKGFGRRIPAVLVAAELGEVLDRELRALEPPSSWRISGDGYGDEPCLWDCGDDNPNAWRILARHDRLPASVWEWLTRVVPPLEPDREGGPDVVVATASLRSTDA
jgi:hypothetical protein